MEAQGETSGSCGCKKCFRADRERTQRAERERWRGKKKILQQGHEKEIGRRLRVALRMEEK